MGDDGPVGLRPLPRSKPRSRGTSAAQPAASSVADGLAQHNGHESLHQQVSAAPMGSMPPGAGGMPSAMGGNVSAMMSSMMNGGAGGMDPAALHAFMEQRRRQLAASPLAQQAMADPGKLAQVLEANPAARAIMESNPRLHQLIASPDAMRGLLQGNAQQFAGVLGQDVEQHMDTVARLNAYSQQLRSERAGSGAAAHARDGSSSAAVLDGFSGGGTKPVVNGGDVAAGPAYPAAAAAHAAAPSLHPAADGHAAAPAPGPAAGQWHSHRQAVSSEIQPAPQLPVSWTPAAAASTAEAAAGGTGSRWSTGMAASPRQNGHTWQHEHAPGQPQKKPAVPHADVLFPIVFCLAIGGLCQLAGRLLPFWLLLVLLLPSFVYGVHLVVLTGGGVDPKRLPATRFTCTLVATLEVLSFAVFAVVVLPRLPHHRAGNILAICLGSWAFVQHYRATVKDPGYLTVPSDPEVAAERGPRFNMGRCDTCSIVRPLRSKHCDYCKRCVLGADHHCPVINNCVGQDNAAVFLAYCLTLLPAQLLFLRGVAAFCRAAVQAPGLGFFAALWRGSALHPAIVLLAFAQVPSVVLNAFLIARGLVCAAANLTTNELMRPSRFGYLADTRDETFLNPFDRGPAANCLQFWRPSQSPDWGSTYGELIQAGPDALAQQVPRFSVTAAVRSAQLANRHLAAARARRRRQREDYILLQAGVRPETLAKAKDTGASGPATSCTSCAHHQHGHGQQHGHGHQHGHSHQPYELQGHLTAAAAPGSSLSAEPFS